MRLLAIHPLAGLGRGIQQLGHVLVALKHTGLYRQVSHEGVVAVGKHADRPREVRGELVGAQHHGAQALDLPQEGENVGFQGWRSRMARSWAWVRDRGTA